MTIFGIAEHFAHISMNFSAYVMVTMLIDHLLALIFVTNCVTMIVNLPEWEEILVSVITADRHFGKILQPIGDLETLHIIQ